MQNNDIWGPKLWYTMHTKSFRYQPTLKHEYKRFYNKDIFELIPCASCRDHYNQYITENPVDDHLTDRTSIVKWVIDLHNFVNASLYKEQLTYDHVIDLYQTNDHYLKTLITSTLAIIGITLLRFSSSKQHSVWGSNP